MIGTTNVNKTTPAFHQDENNAEDLDSFFVADFSGNSEDIDINFFTYLLSERRELEEEVRDLQALYESHLEGNEHTSVVPGVDNMNIDSVKLQLDIARFRLGMVNGYLNNI